MRKLLAVLAPLSACTSKPSYTPTQEKIIKLAQHLEPDSTRYVPLLFGNPQPFTQLDSVDNLRDAYQAEYKRLDERRKDAENILSQGATLHLPSSEIKRRQQACKEASDAVVAHIERNTALLERTSRKQIGQEITHSWRVGERIDSAHFVVFNNGAVRRLK